MKYLWLFLTESSHRKVRGVGILYILVFPLLITMVILGSLTAAPLGEGNQKCPAEPSLPWFLITGGTAITILLLCRIGLQLTTQHIKSKCHQAKGLCCEFSCNLVYDVVIIVIMVMWLVTVSWWVLRHKLGPETLYSVLGEQSLNNFRSSLGDTDIIYNVQFVNPEVSSYCEWFLYTISSSLLCIGWIILIISLIVFIVDKLLTKIVFCKLCRNMTINSSGTEEEQRIIQSQDFHANYTVDV